MEIHQWSENKKVIARVCVHVACVYTITHLPATHTKLEQWLGGGQLLYVSCRV